jgi:hypothetical protein
MFAAQGRFEVSVSVFEGDVLSEYYLQLPKTHWRYQVAQRHAMGDSDW